MRDILLGAIAFQLGAAVTRRHVARARDCVRPREPGNTQVGVLQVRASFDDAVELRNTSPASACLLLQRTS